LTINRSIAQFSWYNATLKLSNFRDYEFSRLRTLYRAVNSDNKPTKTESQKTLPHKTLPHLLIPLKYAPSLKWVHRLILIGFRSYSIFTQANCFQHFPRQIFKNARCLWIQSAGNCSEGTLSFHACVLQAFRKEMLSTTSTTKFFIIILSSSTPQNKPENIFWSWTIPRQKFTVGIKMIYFPYFSRTSRGVTNLPVYCQCLSTMAK